MLRWALALFGRLSIACLHRALAKQHYYKALCIVGIGKVDLLCVFVSLTHKFPTPHSLAGVVWESRHHRANNWSSQSNATALRSCLSHFYLIRCL